MFTIKSYLQYRNTPDGKPKVLVEGVGYHNKTEEGLWQFDSNSEGFYGVANLLDCRPLLTVEIDGVEWTEGDICTYNQEVFTKTGGSYNPEKFIEKYGFVVFDGYQINFELYNKMFHLSNAKNKLGSFFDDPAKYSELIWNCSEEEGWEKVLELLNVEK